MARIPRSELERLKKEIPIERLVMGFAVELKRHGAEWIGTVQRFDELGRLRRAQQFEDPASSDTDETAGVTTDRQFSFTTGGADCELVSNPYRASATTFSTPSDTATRGWRGWTITTATARAGMRSRRAELTG